LQDVQKIKIARRWCTGKDSRSQEALGDMGKDSRSQEALGDMGKDSRSQEALGDTGKDSRSQDDGVRRHGEGGEQWGSKHVGRLIRLKASM